MIRSHGFEMLMCFVYCLVFFKFSILITSCLRVGIFYLIVNVDLISSIILCMCMQCTHSQFKGLTAASFSRSLFTKVLSWMYSCILYFKSVCSRVRTTGVWYTGSRISVTSDGDGPYLLVQIKKHWDFLKKAFSCCVTADSRMQKLDSGIFQLLSV